MLTSSYTATVEPKHNNLCVRNDSVHLRVFFNLQVYTKFAVLKALSAFLERVNGADHLSYLAREILTRVECCLCITIFNMFGNKACILSMLARQVHVVYAYTNEGMFLNKIVTMKVCSSKYVLKNFCSSKMRPQVPAVRVHAHSTDSCPYRSYLSQLCMQCALVTFETGWLANRQNLFLNGY